MKKISLFFVLSLSLLLHVSANWKNFVRFSYFNKETVLDSSIFISSESGLGKYTLHSDSINILTTDCGINSNKIIDMNKYFSSLYLLHDSSISIITPESTYSIPFPIQTGINPQHISKTNDKIYISTESSIISGDFNGIIYQFSSYPSPFGKFRNILLYGDTAVIASDSGLIFSQANAIWDSTTWYKHFKSELNSAHVNKVIFKDRKLYIATDKGMNTYYNNFIGNIPNTGLPDSNITYLTTINNTIYSVIANRVYYLENNMWNIYTPLSGHSIEFIEGKDSTIIASNSGTIYKVDMTEKDSSGNPIITNITPITLINNNIAAINTDNRGKLYILYGPYSSRMDIIQGDSIEHYQFTAGYPTSNGYSIACDRTGRTWVGFWSISDSGIVCIDTNKNEHWYKIPSNAPVVSDIKFDKKNRLWLLNYSDYSNLFMLNTDSTWIKYNNGYTEWMYRIYIDRHNDVWLGSYHIGEASCLDSNGVWHKYTLTGSATVSGFAEINDTTMYIATENGIYIVTNLTDIEHVTQLDNINLTNITDITTDPYNNLWIAIPNEGIYMHHNGVWQHFSTNDGLVSTNFGTVGGGIKKPQKLFAFDKKNNFMYIASFDGISRFYNDSMFVLPDNNVKLHIYPNPVNHGKIYIDLIPDGITVSIYSVSGKFMGKFANTDIKSQLYYDTSTMPPGIYYAVAIKGNRRIAITKFAVTDK
ncbi:hypothetical protein DRP44_06520 [candidate division TA06 bacterium]|uniref:Secretion system C-terminal sorting domain-containing protein n=1 Tax=candidate division TA06 bacterium TaxID=2250710 RepID=A0A660S6D1_UNCT6|nr:MAG: hypothetical protein DRP44_06520 [candidate division TA06 bacterium]